MFSGPEQKAVIERVTGVMSLLEGHADVVMDGVGPEVIPSVADIRRKFTQRRKGVGGLDRLLRRLLGLDQKMAQYRDGAIFVRAAVDKVGMEGFNAVWAEPANLPTKQRSTTPRSGSPASTAEPVALDPARAAVRLAVRRLVPASRQHRQLVACSGGADSLALLAARVFEGHRPGRRVIGVVVDHGLQAGSAEHTAPGGRADGRARGRRDRVDLGDRRPGRCRDRGGAPARRGTPRSASSPATSARDDVHLGHTRDDQAETVLLGLARGSGGRSLQGMRPSFEDGGTTFARPLLGALPRADRGGVPRRRHRPGGPTRTTRTRLRPVTRAAHVLPVLERELGPGIAEALARTGEQLREDMEFIEPLAAEAYAAARVTGGVDLGHVDEPALRSARRPPGRHRGRRDRPGADPCPRARA